MEDGSCRDDWSCGDIWNRSWEERQKRGRRAGCNQQYYYEQYLTVVANRNEIENEEEFKKHPIFSHYVFRYNSYHIFGYD